MALLAIVQWDFTVNVPTIISLLVILGGLFTIGLNFRDQVRDHGIQLNSHAGKLAKLRDDFDTDHDKVVTMWDRLAFHRLPPQRKS